MPALVFNHKQMTPVAFYNRMAQMNLNRLMSASLIGAEDLMAQLNRDQMSMGVDADGADLYYYRSDAYANWKLSLSSYMAAPGIADFKVTGEFHRSIFARVEGDNITFGATDDKTKKLLGLSPNMFGLTDESRKSLNDQYLQGAFVLVIKDFLRI